MMPSSNRKFQYPLAKPWLDSNSRKYLLQAYDSGWISSRGSFIDRFETGFASFVGTKYAVATSNGTTSLHLALTACGIKTGDEVIVPDFTFVAVANAVTYTGARPVFADVNRQYWGIDEEAICQRLTKRSKAVIVVHSYGHPVDIASIRKLCDEKGLYLIEDCAEAHGAEYKGRRVGSFGDISCFSFYGNKILTTGEGGMCLTNDLTLAERMRRLGNHGTDPGVHFWHTVVGFNYRMTNLQAALGYSQLRSLEARIEKYRQVGKWYTRRLQEAGLEPHPETNWAKCVFWMYTTLIKSINVGARVKLEKLLAQEGIETRPAFYPISKLPPYKAASVKNKVSEFLSNHGLSLPTYYQLNEDDIQRICDILLMSLQSI
jgi:perosamine synthetase